MDEQDSIVGGAETLKQLLIFGFIGAFAVLYLHFVIEIWQASDGEPPAFNDGLITIAGTLAGVLGSAFALALGVKKRSDGRVPRLLPDKIARRLAGLSLAVTAGIWVYATIGALAAVTAVANVDETPEVVKGLAGVFGGYILAFASEAFRRIRTS